MMLRVKSLGLPIKIFGAWGNFEATQKSFFREYACTLPW